MSDLKTSIDGIIMVLKDISKLLQHNHIYPCANFVQFAVSYDQPLLSSSQNHMCSWVIFMLAIVINYDNSSWHFYDVNILIRVKIKASFIQKLIYLFEKMKISPNTTWFVNDVGLSCIQAQLLMILASKLWRINCKIECLR